MLVYLEITSFRGISIGAIHYYGKVESETEEYRLLRKVTPAVVKELNRQDSGGYKWRVGEETERWKSEAALRQAAVAYFKEHYPIKDSLLIEGPTYAMEPRPVLCGPATAKNKINQLYRQAEKCGFWDDEETMERICSEWEKVIKPFR